MGDQKSYSLGKSERLKRRKQINQIFETGKKMALFPFRLLYRTEKGNPILKAGFTVSSKNFPRAVDRNRIKRLSREAYRLQKNDLEKTVAKNDCSVYLFFVYTGREIAGYEEISQPLKKLLDKLVKALYEKNPTNT